METRSLCGIWGGGGRCAVHLILVSESPYLGIDDGKSFIVHPPLPESHHYDGQRCPLHHKKCLN